MLSEENVIAVMERMQMSSTCTALRMRLSVKTVVPTSASGTSFFRSFLAATERDAWFY